MHASKTLVFSLFGLIIFGSCQHELHFPPVPGTPPAITSQQGDTVFATLTTYLPLTKNTFWKYKDSTTGKFITLTVSDVQKTMLGKQYEIVSGSLYTSPAFYSMGGHDYFIYHELAGVEKEFLFLNDIAAAGDSWTVDMGLINGKASRGIGTIEQREKTITVEGKIYQHVIHSTFRIYYQLAGSTYSYGGYDYYTAKGIGIVKMESRFGIDNVQTLFTDLKTLVDFSIK